MCDPSETKTNEAQETPETVESPVVVAESEGVVEAEKKEAVAESQNNDYSQEKEKVEPEGVEEVDKKEEVTEAPNNDDSQAKETVETPVAVVEEAEKKEEATESPNNDDSQAKETVEEKKEESEKGTTCLTNESNSKESDIDDANRKTAKTVAGILTRVKEDTEMTDMEKIDTLCVLLSKFVEENGV